MTDYVAQLRLLGFTSGRDFQAAYNLGPALVRDGIVGPKTRGALAVSVGRHHEDRPDISPHFSARSFACHCGGQLVGCRRTLVLRPLLQSLESLRTLDPTIGIGSGYRCPSHNREVGGANASQHLYGTAADVEINGTVDQVRALHLFAGIGYKAKAPHRVTHVDRRDQSEHNTTKGTQKAPTLWTYPG